MTTRMLIDARHQEETRVAVLKGNRIEEFDFESAEHKQIKGNIYLAKVTRVEPSLQAAFVDYGGNRHGFLAFSEIHPDYYQIPKEDKDALLAEEAQHAEEEAALRAAEEEEDGAPEDIDQEDGSQSFADELASGHGLLSEGDEEALSDPETPEVPDDEDEEDTDNADNGDSSQESGSGADSDADADDNSRSGKPRRRGRRNRRGRNAAKGSDEVRKKRLALRRRYKIQDVIHRRQVLLVQVMKEERGNKGAALTTYLSLAGRYCVLMPNSAHGGGISRKISNASDRKRLKTIIADMKLPKTMGCIVRTAGLSRTKTEIKRDFDYLARLWDGIRENTLGASAPEQIHSDSDLIKRAIRDIYNREIQEVLVEGADGYRAAKDFMKLLMPSHARRVKQYTDPTPLFQRYGAEDQLTAMYDPMVQLKSGGYLVINPTEALVSIDINSGRSTKEHGIEATAVSTNLEAAREIARQLRLRDMAGLVVIDFIDMEYGSNVRKVEKAMRDALKADRARIQVGRISGFGLMEMSRQRLRTGVLEASTRICPHCDGSGLVRTASSAGLAALRLLEEEAAKGKGSLLTLRTSQEASIYVLNHKRAGLAEIEDLFGVTIQVLPNGEEEGAKMTVDVSGPKPTKTVELKPIEDLETDDDSTDEAFEAEKGEDKPKRKRRRRGRRGRKNRDSQNQDMASGSNDDEGVSPVEHKADDKQKDDEGDEKPKRKRRSRADNTRKATTGDGDGDGDNSAENGDDSNPVDAVSDETLETEAKEKPKKRTTRRKKSSKAEEAAKGENPDTVSDATAKDTSTKDVATKPATKRKSRSKAKAKPLEEAITAETKGNKKSKGGVGQPANDANGTPVTTGKTGDNTSASVGTADGQTPADGAPRKGWWQRTFGN